MPCLPALAAGGLSRSLALRTRRLLGSVAAGRRRARGACERTRDEHAGAGAVCALLSGELQRVARGPRITLVPRLDMARAIGRESRSGRQHSRPRSGEEISHQEL